MRRGVGGSTDPTVTVYRALDAYLEKSFLASISWHTTAANAAFDLDNVVFSSKPVGRTATQLFIALHVLH